METARVQASSQSASPPTGDPASPETPAGAPPKGNHADTNHQVRTTTSHQHQQLDIDEPLGSSGSQASSFSREPPGAQQPREPFAIGAGGPQITAASNCLTSRASAGSGGGAGPKLSHRSQSSPSSLTTHKFGLRPTPSPPRLIIDHNTGDIVESYPEQPIYLRTYQPLPGDDGDESTLDDSSFSQSLNQASQSVGKRDRMLPHQQQAAPLGYHGQEQHHHRGASTRQQVVIPPPHSGKVYFAPPETSNNILIEPQSGQLFGPARPAGQSSSANAAFKRALNKLHEGRTDIAIVTEPDDEGDYPARGRPGQGPNEMRVTTTSASRGNVLLAQQKQYQQQSANQQRAIHQGPAKSATAAPGAASQLARGAPVRRNNTGHSNISSKSSHQQDEPPAIEDFKLYDFCYNFRVLLVIMLSSLIIYLLVVPLHLDCTKFRPTFTYLSIIVSSVNLICIVIFTLFWYCKGVTRTMYANLSSSAFIVTIYSILVAINLALAIVFFFVNTCHFQKLMVDHPSGHLMLIAADEAPGQHQLADELSHHVHGHMQLHHQHPSTVRLAKRHHQEQDYDDPSQLAVFEAGIVARDEHRGANNNNNNNRLAHRSQRDYHQDTPSSSSSGGAFDFNDATGSDGPQNHSDHFVTPSMSPIEAAWEYFKEQLDELRRNFNQFMINYDLKFIGALHALCAICLQYLAIKVAVVRSYYCSPESVYV